MVGDIERILRALNEARARYLVVGGIAVVLHGYLRTTADLDLVLQLDRDNVLRAMAALSGLQFRPRAPVPMEAFADPSLRETWIREKGLTVFSLWSPQTPGLEVDLFAQEPFDFEQVYGRAVRVRLSDVDVTVISLEDLMSLKRRSSRPVDHADIAALEALTEPYQGPEGGHGV